MLEKRARKGILPEYSSIAIENVGRGAGSFVLALFEAQHTEARIDQSITFHLYLRTPVQPFPSYTTTVTGTTLYPPMAPNLAVVTHQIVRDMILSGTLPQKQMADAAHCSERGIQRITRNLHLFGTTKAPSNGAGRRLRITSHMLDILCEYLLVKPGLYQDEMAVFLFDEFGIHVTTSDVSKSLKSIKWYKKSSRQVAQERNADLRDYHQYIMSEFDSWQLVYIDESGCDQKIGIRRTG
jgi:transposase